MVMITEYERGFRDGMTTTAKLVRQYMEKFSPISDEARDHLSAVVDGIEFGLSMRSLQSKGEVADDGA